jgi:nucleoside-diphosphate-sugar epimerase
MNSVLIVGCGDIGRRLGRLYLQSPPGDRVPVRGLVRSPASQAMAREAGIEALTADLARPETLTDLPTAGALVFYLAPPPSEGETDPWLRHFLAAAQPALPARIVLLSTTAVYGDCQGAWITEQQAPDPQSARGRRRLDAELTLRAWCAQHGVPYVILRVGGIYGPGRWPLERLQQGLPVLRAAESPYTNRIHQDDLARICRAAAERGASGALFNVADGRPGTMTDYFKSVAAHFGLPPPPEVSLTEAKQVLSPGMLSYLEESRRIDNRKLLTELGISLLYPDLAAGLAAARV